MAKISRKIVQIITALIYNSNFEGFFTGRLYRGQLKHICLPGLNCYSCPGAIGSCPIGSMQSLIANQQLRFSFYVTGLLIFFGALFGRFVCGWLCPFGLIQELLHKLPSKKWMRLRYFPNLIYIKYIMLFVAVLIIPLATVAFGEVGIPFFCKYVCSAGTLEAAIPMVLLNPNLQSSLGLIFNWKIFLLAATVFFSVKIYRPFCRFICPLGAVYALFNKVSLIKLNVDDKKCTRCNSCSAACKMEISPCESPNNPECIRCGKCVAKCPHNAIYFFKKEMKKHEVV